MAIATTAAADGSGSYSKLVFLSAAVLLSFAFAIKTAGSYYRLRQFKGPPGAAFSKWWMVRKQIGGRMHLVLGEVSEKYGSLARIGPNELLTDDLEILRKMATVRSRYTRSDWYDVMRLDPNRENILSVRDDNKHNELRAKMATGYSGKEVDNLEESIDRQIAILIKLIDENFVGTSKPFDFARIAEYFTLDVISDIAFGNAFGFLAKNRDMFDYIKTTEETLPFVVVVGILPSLNKILQIKAINKFFMPSVKDKLGLGKIMGIAKDIVAERFGPEKDTRRDMLGSFIRHGLTQWEGESEILVQILAGSDTTATAMRITLLHLITSPSIYNKLLAEITHASKAQRMSRPICDSEAKTLPYLQACITEGLRIHPPVTGLAMKQVPPEGDVLNGQYVPPGTKIASSMWGLYRNKKIWGEDAHVFWPERWLEGGENGPEQLKIMHDAMEFVFSWGKFQCLGKNVAFIELNKVFVELLRNFDFGLVDPMKPALYTYCIGLFIQKDMFLKVERRKERI